MRLPEIRRTHFSDRLYALKYACHCGRKTRASSEYSSCPVVALLISARAAAEPGRPWIYHERCFLSSGRARSPFSAICTAICSFIRLSLSSAVGGVYGRCSSAAAISENIYGLPIAPRATITPSAPVFSSSAVADAASVTSPFATTGIFSAAFTAAMTVGSELPEYSCSRVLPWT